MKYLQLFERWRADNSDAIDYQPLRGTLLSDIIVNRVVSHYNDEIDKYLGGGANGYAFKLKSGKVLKITKDRKEAKAINKIGLNKDFKHIAKYYDLKIFNDIFVTLLDYINPLDEELKPFYNKITHDLLEGILSNEEMVDKYKDLLESNSKYSNFFDILLKQRKSILKEFADNNLEIYEAEGDNVGFDDKGNFKFFDIHLERKHSNRANLDNLTKKIQ